MSAKNRSTGEGRLSVLTVNRVKVVRLLDGLRLNNNEGELRLLRDELLRLVEEPCDLVVNLTVARSVSSTFIGILLDAWFRVRRAGCRVALCHVEPEVLEVFQTLRIDGIFAAITTSEETALAALDAPKPVHVTCPVTKCGGRSPTPRAGPPNPDDFLTCPRCGARYLVGPWPAGGTTPATITVRAFRLTTYEGEYVEVVPGLPATLSVIGRLDLFASQMLERAWLALPAPRRTVIDLRGATVVSGPGAQALLRLWRRREDSRAAILLDAGKPELLSALWGGPAVCRTSDEAVAALGDLSAVAGRQVTVTVRDEA
jgi:anti-anti-sigma regulatory factor